MLVWKIIHLYVALKGMKLMAHFRNPLQDVVLKHFNSISRVGCCYVYFCLLLPIDDKAADAI